MRYRVPEDRNIKEVDFDVDLFMKDMESFMRRQGNEDNGSDLDIEEESSSDMEFDESEDESDIAEPSDEGGSAFMHSYSDTLNEELKGTTLSNTFVRANGSPSRKIGEHLLLQKAWKRFTPVDVDFNLVKNFLGPFLLKKDFLDLPLTCLD
ncbi:hypothetical protein HAX54_004760 [Datura stramonium]|uniref:Uncharacterized protein n=1 Tax=Datura stramonium TaxID=4076 RepID=A0ABS8T897_DATST|nr:hypothetical protein [Datura stramonium]